MEKDIQSLFLASKCPPTCTLGRTQTVRLDYEGRGVRVDSGPVQCVPSVLYIRIAFILSKKSIPQQDAVSPYVVRSRGNF